MSENEKDKLLEEPDHLDVDVLRWGTGRVPEALDKPIPPLPPMKKTRFKSIYDKMVEDREVKPKPHKLTRRATMNIYFNILQAVSQYSKPTRIMYQANLSWKPMTERLEELIRMGFIRTQAGHHDGRTREEFYLTDQGIEIIEYWNKSLLLVEEAIKRMLEEDEKRDV